MVTLVQQFSPLAPQSVRPGPGDWQLVPSVVTIQLPVPPPEERLQAAAEQASIAGRQSPNTRSGFLTADSITDCITKVGTRGPKEPENPARRETPRADSMTSRIPVADTL